MNMILAAASLAIATATQALAPTVDQYVAPQTVSDEVNDPLTFDPRIAFIRALDTPFGVEVQFFAPRNGRITCMVYDADLKPLATGWTFAEIGALDVTEIKASDVEGMICRYADLF